MALEPVHTRQLADERAPHPESRSLHRRFGLGKVYAISTHWTDCGRVPGRQCVSDQDRDGTISLGRPTGAGSAKLKSTIEARVSCTT